MKLSSRTLLAGLIAAVVGVSGAARATTLFSDGLDTDLSAWTSMSGKAEIVADDANGIAPGTLTVAGVPEPSTWALMLAGFAAIGFVASRRNKTFIAPTLA
jgi:NAD/NADP transhydrogenase alpha subunit